MKGLILYDSVYGSTCRCAQEVARRLGDWVVLEKISDKPRKTITGFDLVILASPIRFGKITNRAMSQAMIVSKEIGSALHAAFFCHMTPKEKLKPELLLPGAWNKKLLTTGFFGGEFSLQKASWVDRIISKLVIRFNPECKDGTLDPKAIQAFCRKIQDALPQGENI